MNANVTDSMVMTVVRKFRSKISSKYVIEDLFDMVDDLEFVHDCVIDLVMVSGEELKNNGAGV